MGDRFEVSHGHNREVAHASTKLRCIPRVKGAVFAGRIRRWRRVRRVERRIQVRRGICKHGVSRMVRVADGALHKANCDDQRATKQQLLPGTW